MKIAQVAPLYESVPPKCYGGTERIVSYLTESLVGLGHEVTLYASGDSVTNARLRPMCPKAIRLSKDWIDPVADHILLAEQVFQESKEFDIVHSHIDYLPFPIYRRMKVPHLTTLHGRLDLSNLSNLYREFIDIPLVSISQSQREPLFWANWQGTVYHGIPENYYHFQARPGKYLAFLGRISPEKRLDTAIAISKASRIPLKIAAKIDNVDRAYYETKIEPLMRNEPLIEFLGEINDEEKNSFLGNALALLFPIDWPEPFGLVMIEAMACGTPVIANLQGSVPEIMFPGITGFTVKNIKEAVLAVEKVKTLNRYHCWKYFVERFTARHMAEGYLRIYEKVIHEKRKTKTRARMTSLTGTGREI